MDIELLSKMIGELIPDRHEVGLPGLGTFVSEFVPASFSDRGYTINPPYRRVTFVPGTAEDDSLIKLYASSNGIDEDQSRAILQHFLEGTKKVLMDRKTVVFPGLGRLRATRQNNIFFITDEALDIYPEGFGLEPVSLKNHEESRSEVRHVVESLADILVEPADVAPVQPADVPAAVPAPDDPGTVSETAETAPAEEEVPATAAEEAAIPAAPAEVHEAEVPAPVIEEAGTPAPKEEYVEPLAELRKKEYMEPSAALKKAQYDKPRVRARRRVNKWVWLAPLLLVGLAALAFAVFMILVHAAPDFIDSLLYTPEELRIINW